MNLTNVKPLTPLTHGCILIVGCKPSNFDDELKTHPRIIMWDSQHEHWLKKELPNNTQAVFTTKWVGHDAFVNIHRQTRNRKITLFPSVGTGMIVKQVKELLGLSKPTIVEIKPTMVQTTPEPTTTPVQVKAKLHALIPFIDFSKTNIENAKILIVKGQEMGITSTLASLANFVGVQRKGERKTAPTPKVKAKQDVSVDILDNLIKELQDLRDYFIATVKENNSLKMHIEKFKKVLDND